MAWSTANGYSTSGSLVTDGTYMYYATVATIIQLNMNGTVVNASLSAGFTNIGAARR